jgi:hypothetical protein
MTDALATIVDTQLSPPREGDSDNGWGLAVDPPDAYRWASLLATGAGVFGPRPWWPPTPPPDVRAALLGDVLVGHFPSVSGRPMSRRAHFEDAGMVLVRSTLDGREVWCRGDVGPHGYTAIAAHAHADALSLEVRIDGVEVLADPGTFCYHGEPVWRQYFRGTSSHCTLQVDGRDQSESGGPFLWSRHAATRLLAASGLDAGPVAMWAAEHDGYSRRRAVLLHRRTVELHRSEARLVVIDRLIGAGRHEVCLTFPLGPSVCCQVDGRVARLGWAGQPAPAVLRLAPQLEWRVHRGEETPPLGWYSPSFGRRVPAPILVGRGVITEHDELRCELDLASCM